MPAPHHPQDTEFLMTHPGFKGFFPWATDPVLLAEGQGFRLYQVLYQPGRPYVVEEGHYMQLVFAEDQPGDVGITSDIPFPQVLSINHFWLLAVDRREDTLPEWACEPSWQFGDTQYIALRRAQARDISLISQYLNKAHSPLIGFSGDTH